MQKIRLEALVDTKGVGEEVLGILSNTNVLLRYALLSITKSARNDPERYRLIFYNMSSSIIDYYSSSSSSQDYTASYRHGPDQQQYCL
jgi:hypothetical protein